MRATQFKITGMGTEAKKMTTINVNQPIESGRDAEHPHAFADPDPSPLMGEREFEKRHRLPRVPRNKSATPAGLKTRDPVPPSRPHRLTFGR